MSKSHVIHCFVCHQYCFHYTRDSRTILIIFDSNILFTTKLIIYHFSCCYSSNSHLIPIKYLFIPSKNLILKNISLRIFFFFDWTTPLLNQSNKNSQILLSYWHSNKHNYSAHQSFPLTLFLFHNLSFNS